MNYFNCITLYYHKWVWSTEVKEGPACSPWRPPELPVELPAERVDSSRPQKPTPPELYSYCPHCPGRSYEPAIHNKQ